MGRNCWGGIQNVRADLGIDVGEMGWVMSAFFWAYALAQVPAGWLAHHIGSRIALSCYAVAWSVLCAGFYLVGDIWAVWRCRPVSGWPRRAFSRARPA
ncbi:MAG: hypothetical protein CM1200mP2_17280 [Planctomycetaceae bacterium]|nr:MAG: hypothetical protein CM1200mP2_17280 [Planctomycetaceae bacterium]